MRPLLTAILCFALSATARAEEAPMPITDVHRAIASQNVWLNTSRALTAEDLRGRIVLLDFWTLGCINCMDVIPDLKYLEEKFGNTLTVIGVHSAKFAGERDTANIRAAVLRYGLAHPVVNDADFKIWKRFGVSAWPTFVLVGPLGTVAGVYAGEGHRAQVEAEIGKLIAKYGARVNRAPLPLAPEKNKEPETVLRFPGKIAAYTLFSGRPDPLLVADSGHNRILLVASDTGQVLERMGSGSEGFKDGSFETAQFRHPQGIASDRNRMGALIYIADTGNHAIRVADMKSRTVSTLAGTGQQGFERHPHASPALNTALSSPWDVALYPNADHLAIAMAGTHQIWSLDLKHGTLSLLAGTGEESIEDGKFGANSLSQPSGLSRVGNFLYFVDAETSALRQLKNGEVTTLVGTGLFDFGYKEGDRAHALMQHSLGLAADAENIYVADTYNHSIRRYDARSGTLHNFAGHDARGHTDGALGEASFNQPGAIAREGDALYVADTGNHAIRVIKEGRVSTLNISEHASSPAAAAATAEDALPNLVRLNFAVAKAVPLTLRLGLQKGWHVNAEAPSSLSLYEEGKKEPIQTFSREALAAGPIQLPPANKRRRLSGTIYYCEDKAGSLCQIKSFEITLAPSGLDTALRLPLN